MKYYRKNNKDEELSYWISFSDIMSGVLIVFILLFIFELLQYKSKEILKDGKSDGTGENEISQYVPSTRNEIIKKLSSGFQGSGLDIKIDNNTGVIMLSEEILFDYASSELKPEGKELLKKFAPIYMDTLLSDESIKSQLYEIIIEGHTDSVSTYLFNLKLSQERAYSVAEYILSDDVEYEHKDEVEKYLTANGRSYSKIIKNEDGSENAYASRRVEIKFRLKEDETILKFKSNLD